ncbi:hypothetical protein FGF66_12355 [Chlorobaculum thiosulfatiphilum]|uniref:Uncharacterized protein n=1 Tax=Chlorobaculum thiosulfatiphilum TaxID=115852 RepID=A0A5C4RTC3_CHLTI|nr:hypothetical protein FGF66_12355 [Chlorobaculum thiosulfatiphilum]
MIFRGVFDFLEMPLISSIVIAILWGRNRHIGVWWTLFLMLGFIPGWLTVFSDDIKVDEPSPNSKAKKNTGLAIMGLSSFIAILIYRNRHDILASDIVFFMTLLFWVLRRISWVRASAVPS